MPEMVVGGQAGTKLPNQVNMLIRAHHHPDHHHRLRQRTRSFDISMEDDFGFGTSVWATPVADVPPTKTLDRLPEPAFPSLGNSLKTTPPTLFKETGPFDDNNDFKCSPPSQIVTNAGDDDDFGDFGGFDEGDGSATLGTFAQDEDFGQSAFQNDDSVDWVALHLDPLPSTSHLKDDVERILRPVWPRIDASISLTDEDIRQVGGINQILVTHERYVHAMLQSHRQLIHPFFRT